MTYVRVLKPTGFEQPGKVVDWRGPVDQLIGNGTLELVNEFGETLAKETEAIKQNFLAEAAKAEEAVKAEAPVVEQEAKKVEEAVAPEVTKEVADIKANIAQEEKALEQLETQVEQK